MSEIVQRYRNELTQAIKFLDTIPGDENSTRVLQDGLRKYIRVLNSYEQFPTETRQRIATDIERDLSAVKNLKLQL